MEEKRNVKEVILHIPEKDARILIEGSQAFLCVNGESTPFGADSEILILLIENRGREVSRQEMKKTKGLVTEDKIVPNTIHKIRQMLTGAGMKEEFLQEFLVSTGRGEKYRAKLNAAEADIVYGEEFSRETFLPSSEQKRGFPTLAELSGNCSIRTEYLPHCLFQGREYSRLEACVMDIFKRKPGLPGLEAPLIVSAVGGAGKTFSMLHLYSMAESHMRTAIYVHADSLEDEEHNLLHYICRKYIGSTDRNQDAAVFHRFVTGTDPVLLLIDGMNEVSVSKQEHCCRSFNWMQNTYPAKVRGVFSTRFPQWLKARLYKPLEIQLLPLNLNFLRDKKKELLQRLHMQLTPLLMDLLDHMSQEQLGSIHSRYDLYRVYFDQLADRSSRADASGWVYEVLACVAACSLHGQIISNRWLKAFCAGESEYGFIHSWCAGEEYPLDHPATVEKLKATGFLTKGFGDSYTIHQQYRDYLTVRYCLLQMEFGTLTPEAFLSKLADVTRYYTLTEEEDPAVMNLRRHNNMDLAEFGFYAGLDLYAHRAAAPELVPLLVQLGIQVAYLYDNVQNLSGIYDIHCRMKELLEEYFRSGKTDTLLHRSLPGYYYCLNKLVTRSHNIPQLSSDEELRRFSEQLAGYYTKWLTHTASGEAEERAVALSGLGGVYLARYRIVDDPEAKNNCLEKAIHYHSQSQELRLASGSEKLPLSYVALGTDLYYKGKNSLADGTPAGREEAAKQFREAAEQHKLALLQPANLKPYVSWTRMAGCWYELLLLTPETDPEGRRACRKNLMEAVQCSVEILKETAAESGILRISGEINTLLHDISRFLTVLNLDHSEEELIDSFCELYAQAFPEQKKPERRKDWIAFS